MIIRDGRKSADVEGFHSGGLATTHHAQQFETIKVKNLLSHLDHP